LWVIVLACDVLCCAALCCSGLPDSSVVKGMVLRRDTEGTVKMVKDAKVAVFAQVRSTSCTLRIDSLSRDMPVHGCFAFGAASSNLCCLL
jgi:hypothetical protein